MIKKEITVKSEFFINVLFIEDMISNYIADKFGINNIVDSEILGNSIDGLAKEDLKKFIDALCQASTYYPIKKEKKGAKKTKKK